VKIGGWTVWFFPRKYCWLQFGVAAAPLYASVHLPAFFADETVIQWDQPVQVSGNEAAGEITRRIQEVFSNFLIWNHLAWVSSTIMPRIAAGRRSKERKSRIVSN
jgi:hypothetical protein